MKSFWRFVGGMYLFINGRKKALITLIALIIIVVQFVILVGLSAQVAMLSKNFEEYKVGTTSSLNRVYSQVFLMNTRLNNLLNEKK